MKKYTYFAPNAKVWVRYPPPTTSRYPGTVIQRQSGVYKIHMLEDDSVILVPAKYVSERR
jgi:hypothetical protein